MLQQLIFDGEDYEIPQHRGFAVVAVFMLALVALALIIWSDYKKTGVAILSFQLITFILSKTTHKGSRKIQMKNGKPEAIELRYTNFQKPLLFPWENIQDFELRKTYYARILINVDLVAIYNDKGKIRTIPISQALKVQPMQDLLNEIQELSATV